MGGDDGRPTVALMRAQAAAHDAAVTGSVQLRVAGAVYNRLLWVTPDGAVRHYDKRHLFRMAGEHERYTAGRERLVVEWRGWRVLPLVCYDLRFPVFSRNGRVHTPETAGSAADGTVVPGGGSSVALDYDLVVYVANWPAARQQAWRALLHARAIENLAYCVGVNRTGTDGNGLDFCGGSIVCDFVGETVCELHAAAGSHGRARPHGVDRPSHAVPGAPRRRRLSTHGVTRAISARSRRRAGASCRQGSSRCVRSSGRVPRGGRPCAPSAEGGRGPGRG